MSSMSARAAATGHWSGGAPPVEESSRKKNKTVLAALLKAARGNKTSAEVADACGISRRDFRKMESRDHWDLTPSFALIIRVAKMAGTSQINFDALVVSMQDALAD